MPFQAVPDTAEIRVHYTINNHAMLNTYHAELPGGYNQVDLDVLAARIDLLAAPVLLARQSTHCNYVQTTVVGLAFQNDLRVSDSSNAGSGGVLNSSLPRNNAFVVTRRSDLTGRSARGRVYVCGLPENYLNAAEANNSEIFVGHAVNLTADIDNFRTIIDGSASWQAVIVSRWSDGLKRVNGVTFNWTNSDYQTLQVGSQRLRL